MPQMITPSKTRYATSVNEHWPNQKLSFLDVVDRGDNKFNTSVNRKPTFFGHDLSF